MNLTPNFLSIEQVTRLHEESIRRFSPGESTFIRDQGLLESAVAMPQSSWAGEWLYPSLIEMAAAYLIGLNQNHAFENGNKRVAFAACSTFLLMNGLRLVMTQDEAVELTLAVASHSMDREGVIDRLHNGVEPLQSA